MNATHIPDLDADHYAKHSHTQYDSVQKLLQSLVIRENASVLDVGCGFGNIAAEISATAIRGNVVGVDASQNMIDLAKEKFPTSKYPNLKFYRMNAEDIDFASESFDVILCANTLLWVRKAKKALKVMCKTLKNNGRIFILTYSNNTPYAELFDTVLKKHFSSFRKFSAANTMLSEEEYMQTLVTEGMKLEEVCSKEILYKYDSKEDLKNYVKGWLNCYVPLPKHLQNAFLEKVADESLFFNVGNSDKEIIIPHKSLIIKGKKEQREVERVS